MYYFVISVPLNASFNTVLFSNHFKRSPEEILKLDGKFPVSQALTVWLSASFIFQLRINIFFNHFSIPEGRPDFPYITVCLGTTGNRLITLSHQKHDNKPTKTGEGSRHVRPQIFWTDYC